MSNGGTGLYAFNFAGGPTQNTTFQLLHDALNEARGTAYNTSPGTIVWCENYAYASALTGCWTLLEHLKAEIVPSSSNEFLSRWETIFGLVTTPGETVSARQKALAGKMAQWATPPTLGNIRYYLTQLLGPTFIDVEFFTPGQQYAALPADSPNSATHQLHNYSYQTPAYNNPAGGANLSSQGGVVLPAGSFYSNLFWLKVRVWQPRDQYNNPLMDTPTFLTYINTFQNFMRGYLPAYCLMTTLQFKYRPIRMLGVQYGGISALAGSETITGTGTYFDGYSSGNYIFPAFQPGDPIEVVDSTNALQTYYVQSVNSPTSITTTTPILNNINYIVGNFRTAGFMLDTPDLDGLCGLGR